MNTNTHNTVTVTMHNINTITDKKSKMHGTMTNWIWSLVHES